MNHPLAHGAPRRALHALLARLSPKQRQYATLATLLVVGVGALWLILSLTERRAPALGPSHTEPDTVTHIGVMPPGQQVQPVDQWVGTAGRKLAQYESERDEQTRLNKERQAFEAKTLQRFAELEQKLAAAGQATAAPPAEVPGPAPAATPPAAGLPPAPPPPPPPRPNVPPGGTTPSGVMPAGDPGTAGADLPALPPALPALGRVTVAPRPTPANTPTPGAATASGTAQDPRTIATFLPVSFTRGTLLGGLDAPTGGQSQANPQPVLIRLSDNAVLPNRFRGDYRDCFVIAAGYGDISSERAYLRTESLSCLRADGAALEVKLQGSVYGEDGKVGMRGRLVTKQGQMLANALLAGVTSGIGQGLSSSATSYSSSALGTIASSSGGAEAYRAGLGAGVGRALDRLAQYYIKLAENTFPVIEVDAGREIDVVITKGVRIDVPMTPPPRHAAADTPPPESPELKEHHDDDTY